MKRGAMILVLLALAGCGSGQGPSSSAPTSTASPTTAAPSRAAPTTAAPTTPTKAAASRCLPVPQALLDAIASGEEAGVGGLRLSKGYAVQSKDFKKVYVIAAEITAPGVSGEQGVWASNSLESGGGGLILSVDGFAQQFTVWPDADKTDAKITQAADGVDEAKDCP